MLISRRQISAGLLGCLASLAGVSIVLMSDSPWLPMPFLLLGLVLIVGTNIAIIRDWRAMSKKEPRPDWPRGSGADPSGITPVFPRRIADDLRPRTP